MQPKLQRSDGSVLDVCDISTLNYESMVNGSADLKLGSACADSIEFVLWGANEVAYGSTLTLVEVDTDGTETQAGVFVAEKPKQLTDNTYKVTAYDKMAQFEYDCTDWIARQVFPTGTESYPLLLFARMVAAQRGIALGEVGGMLNSDFVVKPFTLQTGTYRKLVQWIAEVGGCFAHMDAEGNLAFRWYRESEVQIAPYKSDITLAAYAQSHDDYTVKAIGSVRITTQEAVIAAGTSTNVYDISENPLLEYAAADDLQSVAEQILYRLGSAVYTPAEISILATGAVRSGDIVTLIDGKGVSYTVPVMTSSWKAGGLLKLTATGNERRDSATAVSTSANQTYKKAEALRKIAAQIVAAKAELTDALTGVKGGCKIEHTDENGIVYEELFIDTFEESTAKNVMKFNNAGISFSNTGVNGEYTQAISIDGGLVNEWIATWRLSAEIITAGILQSRDGETFYLDLERGILRMVATSLSIGGKPVATEEFAQKQAKEAVGGQTQEDIFNRLTGDGSVQGIYMENGKIYINLEYAKAGKIAAERIDVTNLLITRLLSKSGSKNSYVEMQDNGLNFFLGGALSIGIGYYSDKVALPYIVFGAGVSPTGDKAGMIKMYPNGIWIGDSADRNSSAIYQGTGLFVDVVHRTIYKYVSGAPSIIADDTNVIAIFG